MIDPQLDGTEAGQKPSLARGPAADACPLLANATRAWVATVASGEHRCGAVEPPARLAQDKQRRLCLTATHATCATYLAAQDARRIRVPEADVEGSGWTWVRTTPVVEGRVGLSDRFNPSIGDRGWQSVAAVGLVAALGALGIANLGRPGSPVNASPSLIALASPGASQRPTTAPTQPPSPSAAPSASGEPTPAPSPASSPATTPAPSARTTYTVKSGDTLYGIARTFGTTVTAIKTLNGLTSNTLHVGKVLLIP